MLIRENTTKQPKSLRATILLVHKGLVVRKAHELAEFQKLQYAQLHEDVSNVTSQHRCPLEVEKKVLYGYPSYFFWMD